ncbi:TPA: 50S ribosomal protein L2 [Patescibacteria group bacterium]|nr:50S ribosomal protein L2 [Patescibacteria group bacterium]HCI04651.1 50S ribosomal protein L2 [Patescibacteria group bacterium]
MIMKYFKPTTASKRGSVGILYRDILTKTEPEKNLTKGFKRAVGRNSAGRITVRHKGGGAKRLYREIDFKYDKKDIPATIKSVEYDPNRSGFIGVLAYADGEKRYTLLPTTLKVNDKIIVSEKAEIKPGNRLPLGKIPVGTFIYNVEAQPMSGAKLVRSAGSFAEILAHDNNYALIKMPSTEIRKIPDSAWASIGQVSNEEYKLRNLGKAGRSRHMGRRPTVRGSAMNPVDHPFGGGEGRQGAGMRRPKNMWGKGIRGKKTRTPKKYSNPFIVSRRKNKNKK